MTDEARRVAWIANRKGFEFWLDVLDPVLAGLQGVSSGQRSYLVAIGTASIIEMALHNSTHVLAVITKNTAGSAWVPYEYGRVQRGASAWPAGCWVDPAVERKTTLPEYLYLGPITRSEPEIEQWLDLELAWTDPIPPKL